MNGTTPVVVGAPLAGGPSTPALVAAVSDAGGLGFLASGYRSGREVRDEIAALRELTDRPFGLNLFVPSRPPVDDAAVRAYAERIQPEARRYGVELGEPRWSDDGWDEKLEIALDERPHAVSFTFGPPPADVVAALHEQEIRAWGTVTSVEEARVAVAAGVDTLVVQGADAGGHRALFVDDDAEPVPLLQLLAEVAAAVDLPLVAAGGIADGRSLAAALAAGAVAGQIGTALMLTPEAGTSAAHREAIARGGTTKLTRAFTGRTARGIINRFLTEFSSTAPAAYPQVHYLTGPLRAAARAAGDPEVLNLWAGESFHLAEAAPAGELVRRWIAAAG